MLIFIQSTARRTFVLPLLRPLLLVEVPREEREHAQQFGVSAIGEKDSVHPVHLQLVEEEAVLFGRGLRGALGDQVHPRLDAVGVQLEEQAVLHRKV